MRDNSLQLGTAATADLVGPCLDRSRGTVFLGWVRRTIRDAIETTVTLDWSLIGPGAPELERGRQRSHGWPCHTGCRRPRWGRLCDTGVIFVPFPSSDGMDLLGLKRYHLLQIFRGIGDCRWYQ
jgi:hypothetical protein